MAAGLKEQAARRRAGALLAASVLLHLAVLGPLSLRWLGGPPPVVARDQPVILLDIAPRPLLPDERPRPPAAAAVPLPAPAAGRPVAGRPEAPRVRLRPDDETDRALQGPEAPAGVAVPRDWTVQPEATGERMARALRNSGVGCRLRRETLTAAERAACDEAFGQAAARAARSPAAATPAATPASRRRGPGRWRSTRRGGGPFLAGLGSAGPLRTASAATCAAPAPARTCRTCPASTCARARPPSCVSRPTSWTDTHEKGRDRRRPRPCSAHHSDGDQPSECSSSAARSAGSGSTAASRAWVSSASRELAIFCSARR